MKPGAGRRLCAAATLLALSCAAPPLWELPPPPVVDAPVLKPGTLHRAVLDNGLHVLALEDPRLPRLVLGLAIRRGEGSVDRERAGLALFTAELMARGAGERDALALAEAVDEIGATLSVSAGWDSMSIEISGLSRDLDRLFEILADVSLRPRLEGAEATKARAEQLAGIEKAKDKPATLARWHAARLLYPDHRFGIPREGAPETVATLDVAAARAFYRRNFVPQNAIVYAGGDLGAEEFQARVRAAFGAWTGGAVPEPTPPPPTPAPPARRIVVVDQPELSQAQVIISHEGIRRADPRRIRASVMNSILGGSGFSSRLMASIRAEAGLAYGVYSYFGMRRVPGPFVVSTSTRVNEVGRVVEMILAELERIRSAPPGEMELHEIKSLNVGRFALGLETSDAVLSALVSLDLYELPEDSLDTYRERVRAVTLAATEQIAHALVHPERVAIVAVGPAEVLVPQLESFGAVAVVKP